MNRTVEIDIAGKTWPMLLTLWAYSKICDEYGSMSDCLKTLDGLVKAGDNRGLIQHYTGLMDTLLLAAAHKPASQEVCPPNPPDRLMLLDLFSPGDLPYIQRKVLEAIQVGQSREVGAEAPKNGEGAAEGPAPEG